VAPEEVPSTDATWPRSYVVPEIRAGGTPPDFRVTTLASRILGQERAHSRARPLQIIDWLERRRALRARMGMHR